MRAKRRSRHSRQRQPETDVMAGWRGFAAALTAIVGRPIRKAREWATLSEGLQSGSRVSPVLKACKFCFIFELRPAQQLPMFRGSKYGHTRQQSRGRAMGIATSSLPSRYNMLDNYSNAFKCKFDAEAAP